MPPERAYGHATRPTPASRGNPADGGVASPGGPYFALSAVLAILGLLLLAGSWSEPVSAPPIAASRRLDAATIAPDRAPVPPTIPARPFALLGTPRARWDWHQWPCEGILRDWRCPTQFPLLTEHRRQ